MSKTLISGMIVWLRDLGKKIGTFGLIVFVYALYRASKRKSARLRGNFTSSAKALRLEGVRNGGSLATLPHGYTHYKIEEATDGGRTKNLVVLVHGFTGSSEYFEPIVSFLVNIKGRRVLTYDLFGRGHSECRGADQTADLFASQLAGLLFHLGETRPIDLVGYSMGGIIATRFAACWPQRVRSLILLAPAGLPSLRKQKFPGILDVVLSVPGVPELLGASVVEKGCSRERYAKEWTNVTESRFEEQFFSQRRRMRTEPALSRVVGSSLLHMPWGEMGPDLVSLRKHVSLPVIVVWGSEDGVVPVTGAKEIKSLLPRTLIRILKDLGHAAPIEAAELVAYEAFAALESALAKEETPAAEDPSESASKMTSS